MKPESAEPGAAKDVELEELSRRVMNKLIHAPTKALRDAACQHSTPSMRRNVSAGKRCVSIDMERGFG